MKNILITLGLILIPMLAIAAEDKEDVVEKLNSMLRGEISAVETYNQALKKVGDEPGSVELKAIRDQHAEAADKLRKEITALGGIPKDDSGAWGTWAKTVEGTAKLLGDANALRALREGEKHGLDEYQDALTDDEVNASTKTLIRDTLIKRQQENIATLDKWIANS